MPHARLVMPLHKTLSGCPCILNLHALALVNVNACVSMQPLFTAEKLGTCVSA